METVSSLQNLAETSFTSEPEPEFEPAFIVPKQEKKNDQGSDLDVDFDGLTEEDLKELDDLPTCHWSDLTKSWIFPAAQDRPAPETSEIERGFSALRIEKPLKIIVRPLPLPKPRSYWWRLVQCRNTRPVHVLPTIEE